MLKSLKVTNVGQSFSPRKVSSASLAKLRFTTDGHQTRCEVAMSII